MILQLILVLIITLILYVFYLDSKTKKYWKNKHVFSPPSTPIVGHFAPMLMKKRSFAEIAQDFYNSHDGRYIGIYRFSDPFLVIKDLETYKQIYIKDFDHFVDHQDITISQKMDPIFANSLVFLKGQKWKDMRSTLSPAFTGSKMRGMFVLMRDTAQQFVKHLSNQTKILNSEVLTVDSKDIFSKYTIDVVANCAFGIKCNSIENDQNEFYQKSKNAVNLRGLRTLKLFLYMLCPKVLEFLNIPIFEKDLQDYFINIIKDNMRYREKEGIVRKDMIHLLMQARKGQLKHEESEENSEETGFATAEEVRLEDRPKKALTDTELVAQAIQFLSAGSDPTALLLSFFAYELALNPDCQTKLHEEIDDLRTELDGEPISYEKLMNLKYLDMVICETLRKWPVAVVQDRKCVKPYTIQPKNPNEKPLEIDVGVIIVAPTFSFHRDPNYFKNPLKFDPERFNEENRKNIVPYSFMPFGFGPRNCIGNRFALLEIKTLIFHLFSEFEVEVVEKTPIPIVQAKLDVVLSPESPIWLGLKKRSPLT